MCVSDVVCDVLPQHPGTGSGKDRHGGRGRGCRGGASQLRPFRLTRIAVGTAAGYSAAIRAPCRKGWCCARWLVVERLDDGAVDREQLRASGAFSWWRRRWCRPRRMGRFALGWVTWTELGDAVDRGEQAKQPQRPEGKAAEHVGCPVHAQRHPGQADQPGQPGRSRPDGDLAGPAGVAAASRQASMR